MRKAVEVKLRIVAGLQRLLFWRRAEAARRFEAEQQMSPRERAFVEERVEDHGADEFVDSVLGGVHSPRPVDEDDPRFD
jgi:hypothetical protein